VVRRHKELLREAGFGDVRASATAAHDRTPEATTKRGDLAAALLQHMAEAGVKAGWTTAAEMDGLARASRAWGRHPDAFDAILWCEAVGWKR
jgi:hypothetical protein